MAMRGELSKREESDSSSSKLYLSILEEKDQLIKSGIIRKDGKIEEPISEYDIPDSWIWVKFGKIITLRSGQDLLGTEYNSDGIGIPYITGASNFNEDGSLTINRWTNKPKAYARCGDMLISCKGTVGKITILDKKEVHIARQIMGIKTYHINTSFAKYFVESEIDKIKDASKGLIPGIERNDILELNFPLPPIEEQERIVKKIMEVLELLDMIDDLQKSYLTDIELLKSKIIDAGIRGELTEQLPEDGTANELSQNYIEDIISQEEKLLDLPSNWSWVKLGWAIEIERGGSPRPIKAFVTDSDDGINWIKISDVAKDGKYIYQTKEKINPEGEQKSRKVYPGDFLLTNSMSFGRPYISKIEGCIHDGWLLLRNKNAIFDLDYLYWLLSSGYAFRQFSKMATGATVSNLNKDKVASAVFPLPPLSEQKRIANIIETVIEKCR